MRDNMSVLRLLHHSKAAPPTSSPTGWQSHASHHSKDLQLTLDVAGYGGVHVRRPDVWGVGSDDAEPPKSNPVLPGVLRISIPVGSGRKRVKGIKVYLRSTCVLDMGPGRAKEEDVLFERGVDMLDGVEQDGLWLDEGTQLFYFGIILPDDIAPHNRVPTATVRHVLHAQVDGLCVSHSSRLLGSLRPRTGSINLLHNNHEPKSRASSFSSLRRPSSVGPPTPPNDAGDSQSTLDTDDWLKGVYTTEREIMIIYNPNSLNEVTVLNINFNNIVQPWCSITLRYDSPSWSVASMLSARLKASSLSPFATIFCVRLSLSQRQTITSPRDGPEARPIVHTRKHVLSTVGKIPDGEPASTHRDPHTLWQGTKVGGKDTRPLAIEMLAKLPNHDVIRPSTLLGVKTPLRISHGLHMEVFFSIWGRDNRNKEMPKPGPGGVRVLKIDRRVNVPSCWITHAMVDLPTYDSVGKQERFGNAADNTPCSLCHYSRYERLCQTCPPNTALHPRHDHDPRTIGDANGRCRLCCVDGFLPTGGLPRSLCACGMESEELAESMRQLSVSEVDDERVADDAFWSAKSELMGHAAYEAKEDVVSHRGVVSE